MKHLSFVFLIFIACNYYVTAQECSEENKKASQKGFAPEGYSLAWHDEFNDDKLDPYKWFYRDGISREITILARENVIVEHGELNLVCQVGDFAVAPEQYQYSGDKESFNYKGAGIISDWRFSEGYYEARSGLILADQWHPAFWLELANADDRNGLWRWTGRSEIDIMECEPQRPTKQSIRVHDKVTGGEHRKLPPVTGEKRYTTSSDQTKGWFVWGLKLTRNQAKFYENGKLVVTVNIPENYARDSRNIILSCLTLKQPRESGIQKFDWVRYYEPQSLRNSPRKECEKLIQQTSLAGRYFRNLKDSGASNEYMQVIQNAEKEDYVSYRVYVREEGKYRIKFGGYQEPQNTGRWQLKIDGKNQSNLISQQGEEGYRSWDLGKKAFPEKGYYEFTFVCQNCRDKKCQGSFDYIELIRFKKNSGYQ